MKWKGRSPGRRNFLGVADGTLDKFVSSAIVHNDEDDGTKAILGLVVKLTNEAFYLTSFYSMLFSRLMLLGRHCVSHIPSLDPPEFGMPVLIKIPEQHT